VLIGLRTVSIREWIGRDFLVYNNKKEFERIEILREHEQVRDFVVVLLD